MMEQEHFKVLSPITPKVVGSRLEYLQVANADADLTNWLKFRSKHISSVQNLRIMVKFKDLK